MIIAEILQRDDFELVVIEDWYWELTRKYPNGDWDILIDGEWFPEYFPEELEELYKEFKGDKNDF